MCLHEVGRGPGPGEVGTLRQGSVGQLPIRSLGAQAGVGYGFSRAYAGSGRPFVEMLMRVYLWAEMEEVVVAEGQAGPQRAMSTLH